jgi:hypothetical protein
MPSNLERASWIAGVASALIAIAALWSSNSGKEKEIERLKQSNVQVNQQTVNVNPGAKEPSAKDGLTVELVGVSYPPISSCGSSGSATVTEQFALKSDGNPMTMIMAHSDHTGAVDMIRSDGNRGLEVESAYPGWKYTYCAPKGWKQIYYVRFFDPVTGRSSPQVAVKVDVPA